MPAPYGHSTIYDHESEPYVETFEMWQPYGNLYVDYQRNPADKIPPPPRQARHNMMLDIKPLCHYDVFPEEDEEGYIDDKDAHWDSPVSSENHGLSDQHEQWAYEAGEVGLTYMDLIGLGAWARKWDADKPWRDMLDEAYHEHSIREQERRQEERRRAMLGQVEVTNSMLQARANMTREELTFNDYLQRRRAAREAARNDF